MRALALTMAVMCYLACLALGGLLLVERATVEWGQSVSNEVTVLVRPLEGHDSDAEVAKAERLLKAADGILAVTVLDKGAAAKLLEPWLGQDVPSELPVPRLISVKIDGKAPPDFAKIAASLAEEVKGASLDTHQRWQAEFARLGRSLALLAGFVLALIALASITLVAYAARSVMESNANVVDVLQMVGAEPRFISRANDQRFLNAGLAAGGFGFVAGLATFILLTQASGADSQGMIAAAQSLLFGNAHAWQTLALLLLVPVAATLIAVWAARLALLRDLGRR